MLLSSGVMTAREYNYIGVEKAEGVSRV